MNDIQPRAPETFHLGLSTPGPLNDINRHLFCFVALCNVALFLSNFCNLSAKSIGNLAYVNHSDFVC